MELNVTKLGNALVVLASVFAPGTRTAEDPTSAQALFFTTTSDGTGLIAHPVLTPAAMAKQGTLKGIWTALVDVTSVNINELVVVVEATVGGNVRTQTIVMDPANSRVSGPSITSTVGPVVG